MSLKMLFLCISVTGLYSSKRNKTQTCKRPPKLS